MKGKHLNIKNFNVENIMKTFKKLLLETTKQNS